MFFRLDVGSGFQVREYYLTTSHARRVRITLLYPKPIIGSSCTSFSTSPPFLHGSKKALSHQGIQYHSILETSRPSNSGVLSLSVLLILLPAPNPIQTFPTPIIIVWIGRHPFAFEAPPYPASLKTSQPSLAFGSLLENVCSIQAFGLVSYYPKMKGWGLFYYRLSRYN